MENPNCSYNPKPRPLQFFPGSQKAVEEMEPELLKAGSSFRDRTPTIGESGKRNWIYPRKPNGAFYKYRTYVSYLLLTILFVNPFIKIGDQPIFLFNFIERKFVLFGVVFWPQDFYLFALSFLTIAIFAVLFTAIFGRIWCGWACPQTIFMEMVFRKLEYFLEGGANEQKKLNEMPWNAFKIRKKATKFIIFYLLSFIVGNLLLSYIIGIEKLQAIITDPPSEHIAGLIAMFMFSALFFWIFTWFREQACTFVCPYGRLQSVLIDKNTIVVAYDHKRGEPRAKFKKNRDESKGDCVDCHKCVQVCPTGIDIRNGTQLECINCTACIDACDSTMVQVGMPKGLIRYTSENNIVAGEKFKFTPRLILYSTILTMLITTLLILFTLRKEVDVTILRTKGTTTYQLDDNKVMNMLTINLVNKTDKNKNLEIRTKDIDAKLILIGYDKLVVPASSILKAQFQLILNKDDLKFGSNKIEFEILENGKIINSSKTNFLNNVGQK